MRRRVCVEACSPLKRPSRACQQDAQVATGERSARRPRPWQIATDHGGQGPPAPPLARGTRVVVPQRERRFRVIPARAGNTYCCSDEIFQETGHPRSRGEHAVSGGGGQVFNGSSPLARGTRHDCINIRLARRVIPARAGNTTEFWAVRLHIAGHPRSRGEHPGEVDGAEPDDGSSPLARGTQNKRDETECCTRVIPARAGNTDHSGHCIRAATGHPRSRGEHRAMPDGKATSAGSSPLARGTRSLPALRHALHRVIPARAGNTPIDQRCAFADTGHPRSRGEHFSQPVSARIRPGSSPLARGTHIRLVRNRRNGRVIPARAGNTGVL